MFLYGIIIATSEHGPFCILKCKILSFHYWGIYMYTCKINSDEMSVAK